MQRETIEFLGIWERLHNPNFNPVEFDGFRSQAGLNAFTMSPTKWIEGVNAIGTVLGQLDTRLLPDVKKE